MDNPRLYLWIGLALLGWMNVVTWNRDYGSPPVATSVATDPAAAGAQSAEQAAAAAATAAANAQLPALPTGQPTTEAAATTDPTVPAAAVATGQPSIRVVTDVLDLDISLQGGDFVRADLLQYPRDKRPGSPPVRLFGTQEPDYSVARTGLRALNGRPEPTHLATFTSTANEFRLAPGATELRVPLSWNDGLGVTVTKTYVFRPGSYAIEVLYDVDNRSASEWSGASYVQLARHVYAQERSMFDVESYAYRGPAVWDGSKYRKLDVDDEEDGRYAQNVTDGWMATMQHHFVSAAVPPKGGEYHVTLAREGSHALLTHRGPLKTVPAGTTGRFSETIFVGPKLQDQLKEVGPRLELTADYGKLTILSQPLFWLLQKVHGFVGNWGWSIIIVTILLKLLFYKLTETSGRSMAKMRTIAPRIKSIQERYKDDREQLAKQMMEIYKREKINPVAGCLPILVQIPVFLAFYWVLLESVEMRQAPWMLWIQDLSSKDPFFVLPILMGVAMYGQFKLNPAPPDPMQAKIFAFMPVIMTVMMAWFPSGLVLYWLTNTLLSIAQQWNINRVVEAEAKKRA
ncbi:MAG: YidC/Oxa1 family rane protein insertase [Pseudomonadota bacterium]|nr:YidC/Oxa1 family rane protein insertase [Pseudomonadota bacterium]